MSMTAIVAVWAVMSLFGPEENNLDSVPAKIGEAIIQEVGFRPQVIEEETLIE